jgi:hypothetical protein
MLKYSLSENLLTDRPDDYSAQTHTVESLDKEAIIARILNKGTTVTKTDVLAVFNSIEEVIQMNTDYLCAKIRSKPKIL